MIWLWLWRDVRYDGVMRVSPTKIIIGLTGLSLIVQVGGAYAVVRKLHSLPHLSDIALAAGFEVAAFLVLVPLMRRFYSLYDIRLKRGEATALIFASEGYSHVLPFGDYIAQRYYFGRTKRAGGPILAYITVLYSFAVIALIGIFFTCQVLVTILYPNKVTSSLLGKFALFPFFVTGLIVLILLTRRTKFIRRSVNGFFRKNFKSRPDSPFAIIRSHHLTPLETLRLLSPTLLTWLIESIAFYLCLRSFGVQPPFLLCLYAFSFVKVFRFIPIFPGGVGEIETISALLLGSYGYPAVPVIGGAICFRLISYWLPLTIGAVSFASLTKPRLPKLWRGAQRRTQLVGVILFQTVAVLAVIGYAATNPLTPDHGLQQIDALTINDTVPIISATVTKPTLILFTSDSDTKCAAQLAHYRSVYRAGRGLHQRYDIRVSQDETLASEVALPEALRGCNPGYALFDAHGHIRYRTYDPQYDRHSDEQNILMENLEMKMTGDHV